MANEATVKTSCIQESQEADECRENIPPAVTAAAGMSKFKVQEGDVGFSFTQPCGENEPLSDACTFSTPAPTSSIGQGKVKSRLSGLQSALTPILKYLNIGNKCPSPEPLKHGNNPHLKSQHPSSDFSTCHTGPSSGDTKAPVCWLNDEYLPEITLLDITGDSMMQVTKNDSALSDSVPTTPVTAASVKTTFIRQNKTMDQSKVSSPKVESDPIDQASSGSKNTTETSLVRNQNSSKTKPPFKQNDKITVTETCLTDRTTTDKPSPPKVCNANEVRLHELLKQNATSSSEDPNDKIADIPESIDAPLRWLDDRYFPEITLLEVTRDSEFSPGMEVSSMNVTQDTSPLQNDMTPSELSEKVAAEPGILDMIQSQDLSSTLEGNVTHTISSFSEQSDKCVGENTQKASLEGTRDISMSSGLEDSEPSLEPSGQNMAKIQTSAEDTDTHPANVTRDISSSSDMSVQCAASQLSASDVECNTTSENITSELQGEPAVTSNTVEGNNDELLSSQDAELSSKVQQLSPKPTGSVNNTLTVAMQFNMSVSTSVNTAAQIPCPQNKTLDLPPSNVNSPKAESDTKDLAISVSKNTSGPAPVVDPNCSPANANGSCNVQNVTFDRNSLHKSSGSSILGEAVAGTFCLQNTFDTKSPVKQNGTITVSETSSSDGHLNTLDKLSPPKACNLTSSPKDNNSEVNPPEISKHNEATASTDPDAKMVDTPEGTFEANPAVEVASGAGRGETKDHSQLGLSMRDGLSDSLGHQSMDVEDNKVNTFNLDDTLDLKADALITSTPMTNCKIFNFHTERQEGRIIGAQKKLYGDGPRKPDGGQAPSDVPPNIVCDRKTFLTQTAPKYLLPPVKAASHLLKYKPASLLPGRFDPLTSGLPMTRQRTQAEALRNTAASDAPRVTTGISAPYNLRASTTGSKQPNLGLRKPQLSGIPSGIQRAAPGLKPPSARINAQLSSSTEKLCGPPATNTATKISQAKKHALTRGEALPIAKRKKMDAPLPCAGAAASTSSCDAAHKTKNLKPPTTSQRSLPAKIQRDDTAVPASTAEPSTCNAVSRAKALKQPVTSHRAALPKPQSHGCAKCAVLEQQLKLKSEEIKRLKEELLKYRKPEEEC
ncbi:hypothetical protein D5F01_LYC17597 [Larimichthys crocea]|uniref:Uncharacterized protein n=1 Tax=Larimichthys crocea TaxID=215358 RepID=A0A6G0HZ68_LARCR|nr:hypothetical protein D5F01_LYC17597 [Larimichthys crocea]